MSRGWRFTSSDWSFECDSCGQKKKASVARLRWDGFRVCPECFEVRHPQDFLRARTDNQAVPWARSKQAPVFIQGNFSIPITDITTLTESIISSATYYRYIGTVIYPEDKDTVNGRTLNFAVLNLNSVDLPPLPNDEKVTLSETIALSYGYGIIVNDTLTLSENISESENEISGDSLGLTESISYSITTNRILNMHKFNEVLLG